jgi:hypothetical protein
LGRQQRLQGTEGGPLAWFAIQEVIDHQVVRAIWTDERLTCDRLLVLGPGCWSTWSAEFHSDDPPRRYHASPNITVEVGPRCGHRS